jgi:hypothetical protein
MNRYTTIDYLGASIEVQDWMAPLWPDDLQWSRWPSYCGAGYGIGDYIIPDTFGTARGAPACFIHDLDYATLPKEWWPFQQSNNRLYVNLVSILSAQIYDPKQLAKAKAKARRYWIAVSVFGWPHFEPESENPWSNQTVREKLNRLAKARYL